MPGGNGVLFERLDHPVAEVEISGATAVVCRVNPAFESTFGVEGADVEGADLTEVVVPDDEAVHERALDVYVRAGSGHRVTEAVTRLTAEGRREFQLQAIPFEHEGASRAYLVYADVSDRTERERSLSEMQSATMELLGATDRETVARVAVESLQDVLDVSIAVLYGFDEAEDALVPLAATDGARALFGEVPAVERGGGPTWYVYEMGDPLVTDDVRSMEARQEPDRPVRSEIVVPVGDHGVLVASSTEVGVFDETDETLARTLARTLEAAFDRAEREALLRARERELRRENERLEEFAGIVSHDLRSPLTVVKGNASLLRDEGDAKYLDRIESAADRMDALIEDLLALARQGAMVDEPENVELADAVRDAWATADTRAATLSADADVTVAADPGRLQQLLQNLFNNAAEHGATSRRPEADDAVEHGGPDVTVTVGVLEADADDRPGGRYGRAVEGFYVADDGPGLPETDGDDIFEAGVSTEEDGTGFGLAIVARIAEAHGWDVTATESEAGGARFEFTGVEGA